MNHALPSAVTAAVFAPRQSLVTGIAKLPHPQISEKAAADPMAISKSDRTVTDRLLVQWLIRQASVTFRYRHCLRCRSASGHGNEAVSTGLSSKFNEAAGQIWRNEQVIHDIHVLLGRQTKGSENMRKTATIQIILRTHLLPLGLEQGITEESIRNILLYIYIYT